MSAIDKDESEIGNNVRFLRREQVTETRLQAPRSRSKTDGIELSHSLSTKRTGCDTDQDLIHPGTFTNIGMKRIAKRLCEYMNLNYNLCCQLEHIADGLPGNVNKQECLHVARSIIPVVRLSHEFEEEVLFPLLREKTEGSEQLDKTLDRLQAEHLEDESYASEIHNSLITLAGGIREINAESLGYMLRGFFEGMRRHLAFEREHVLPILEQLDAAT